MMLAGMPVRDQDALALAGMLHDAGFDETAETLEDAYYVETKVLALTIVDRRRSCGRSTIRLGPLLSFGGAPRRARVRVAAAGRARLVR